MNITVLLAIAACVVASGAQLTDGSGVEPWPTLDHLRRTSEPLQQTVAVIALVRRLLPNHHQQIIMKVEETHVLTTTDTFSVSGGGNQPLRVVGSSGVAAAWALHRYLREVCNASISWDGDQLTLPEKLPAASFSGTSTQRYRYYLNMCTFSYSFAWWDWSRWEREVDWMALNGINLALALVGQEDVWRRVYLKIGLNQTDIDHHFSGPAFLAWNRAGNLRGWGGPLSNIWHRRTVLLQKSILRRMRDLGIVPILPGFSGIVPTAFKDVDPTVDTVPLGRWINFEDKYCCPLLIQPSDPKFISFGVLYLKELISTFGTNHLYAADPFNEMKPKQTDLAYVSKVSAAIYNSMKQVDPDAVWVIQGWVFTHDASYWTPKHVEAFLTAVPKGRILALDLMAELHKGYKLFNSFHGHPFIWCMLHNFGATLGMYGADHFTNEGLFETKEVANNTMVGSGISTEGTGQNYVMYDLMLQLNWQTQPFNLTTWFTDYHTRRYGRYNEDADKAWQILKSSVYNNTNTTFHAHGKSIIGLHPLLEMQPEPIWYKPDEIRKAWESMLQASRNLSSSSLFLHDLIDVTRQGLQLTGAALHQEIVSSFLKKDYANLIVASDSIIEMLIDLDEILSTGKNFLVGPWLEDAKSWGTTPEEKIQYEYNARNQITLWGPNGEVRDYANKQWAGVVFKYFRPRWIIFTSELQKSLRSNTTFDQKRVSRRIFTEVEEPFTFDRSPFPTQPYGDTVAVSRRLYKRWHHILGNYNPLSDNTWKL